MDAGAAKINAMRPVAEKHGLTMLQLACAWNLSQAPVKSVIPTLMQEVAQVNGVTPKTIEEKIDELAALPSVTLSADEVARMFEIGNNKGCMELKGGNPGHTGEPLPDRWPLNDELLAIAARWEIEPTRDLACTHGKAA